MYSDTDVVFLVSQPVAARELRIVNAGGFTEDVLSIYLDHQLVSSHKLSPRMFSVNLVGQAEVDVGASVVTVRWTVSQWFRPTVIEVVDGGRVLARHRGKGPARYQVPMIGAAKPVAAVASDDDVVLSGIRSTDEQWMVVATEQFPLDNRGGSDVFACEHEIARTVTNNLELNGSASTNLEVGGALLRILHAKAAASLSAQLGVNFGESVTRRQTLRFSVRPGQRAVYTVVWKQSKRDGELNAVYQGRPLRMPFSAYFGLSYEVQSVSDAQIERT